MSAEKYKYRCLLECTSIRGCVLVNMLIFISLILFLMSKFGNQGFKIDKRALYNIIWHLFSRGDFSQNMVIYTYIHI